MLQSMGSQAGHKLATKQFLSQENILGFWAGWCLYMLVNERQMDLLGMCSLTPEGLQDNVQLLWVQPDSKLEFSASVTIVHSLGLASTLCHGKTGYLLCSPKDKGTLPFQGKPLRQVSSQFPLSCHMPEFISWGCTLG